MNVSVPDGIAPTTFTGSTILSFDNHSSQTLTWTVDVAEHRNYTVDLMNQKTNISIGESGRFATLSIDNTGNVRVPFTVGIEGPVANYLSVSPSITSYAGNTINETITYGVTRDTEFGTYTGNITLDPGQGNVTTIPVEARFLDEITPRIEEDGLIFDDFMATKPENFTVSATDNLRVDRVTANATYTVQVTEGNNTVTETRTLERYNFSQVPNTDVWTVKPENADRIGNYDVQGVVVDEAGNKKLFNSSFRIEGLNVTHPVTDLSIPSYQVGTDVEIPVLDVERDTDVEVTLASFSRDLSSSSSSNGTWEVGIEGPGGRQYFESVNDTVQLVDGGEYDLYLYGTVDRMPSSGKVVYNGRLSFDGVPQHVAIPDTQFYGDFKNWTQPRNRTIEAVNLTYDCRGERGETQDNSGWYCSVHIPRSYVDDGKTLDESVSFVVPEEKEQEIKERFSNQIDRLNSEVSSANRRTVGMSAVILLLFAAIGYFVKYHPEYWHFPQKSKGD